MNEIQNTPELRFEGFAEPWEQKELGKLVDVCNGKDYKHLDKGDIPVYGTGGYMTSVSEALSYSEDAIGIGRKGTIDKPYILRAPFWTVDTLFYAIPKHEVDLDFALCLFSNINWRSKDESSGVPSLSKQTIDTTQAKIPEFAEQHIIGVFSHNLASFIALHQRKYERLQHLKQALLRKMFPKPGEQVPELRFDGFTEPWEERKLGEIGEVKTGNTPSTANENYYSKKGTPWITPTDIRENGTYSVNKHLSTEGMSVAQLAPAGSILCTCIASIGKNTFTETTCGFNQQINALIPAHDTFDSYFLFFESALWSVQMKSNAASGTMQIVNKTEFSKLEAMIPSLPEQKIIGTFFSNLDSLITLHQRKYERLQHLKQALLRKMFI